MRYFVHCFGCQMSFHDGERVRIVLARAGHQPASDLHTAELVVVTTCTVRAKAEAKAFSWIGRLRGLKARRPGAVLAVVGCLGQHHGRAVLHRAPHVDIVAGTGAVERLPAHVETVVRRRHRIVDLDPPAAGENLAGQPPFPVKAHVVIMRGCDNFCSYCIVPHVRGREWSRPGAEVLAEVERLVAGRVREVTLIGQNVNSYRPAGEELDFPGLLARVAAVPGLARLRFVTSHPRDVSPELARTMADWPAIAPHLHLPVQSGSDRVLAAMNRGYRRADYLKRVDWLREAVPEIALTTDFLVGFAGETDADHAESLSLLEEVGFDTAFAFAYSVRRRTAAARLADDVPAPVKRTRLVELIQLQAGRTAARRQAAVGTVQDVLIEGRDERGTALAGRTPAGVMVHLAGPEDWIGRSVPVAIREATPHCLYGESAAPAADGRPENSAPPMLQVASPTPPGL